MRSLRDRRLQLENIVRQGVKVSDALRVEIPSHDAGDIAGAVYDQVVAVSLNRMQYGKKEKARKALYRLKNKIHDMCIDCGKRISDKRLKSIPWAERCTECQAAKERSLVC